MSKIYIVKSAKGQYEDYREWNAKAFTTKEKAYEFAKELDKIHRSKPDFITEEFINAYNECYDNLPDWGDFPLTKENGLKFIEWQEECTEKDREILIKELSKKGFSVTEDTLDQYEQWEIDSYDEYYDCKVEELELE